MQLAVAAGSGLGLVPVFYITSIIAVLITGAFGLYRWQKSQRQQWIDEGAQATRQAEALTANTEAARRNTEAIGQLTGELRAFVTETRTQLKLQDERIGKIEKKAPPRRRGGASGGREPPS